ncbi:MAG: response regulator, partial [Candidatus Latescibacteria bacterium]|nr:response regulator [Candidatus Latescibacterota bacterium]
KTIGGMVQAVLNRFQYQVRWAETGAAGLSELTSFSPDLVLLDVSLPDMDGVEVLHQMRMIFPKVKIIMMTEFHDDNLTQQARNEGVTDFLDKPFTVQELIDLVSGYFPTPPVT